MNQKGTVSMLKMFRRLFSLFRRSKNRDDAGLPLPSLKPSTSDFPQPTDLKPKKPVSEPVPEIPSPREDSSFDLTVPARKPLHLGPPPQNPQIEKLKRVLNVLRAYVVNFGWPQESMELRAIVGAIVANLPTVEVANRDLERFIDQAIAASKSLDMESGLIDVTAQLLAEQVFVWLREQQTTVSNVVSAYLQQFAPDDETWEASKILGLVQTVVAVLNDGSLSRSGGTDARAKSS